MPVERAVATRAPAAELAPSVRRAASATRRAPRRRRHRGTVIAWVFLAPALAVFGVFKFWPTVKGVVQSFQKVRPYLGNQWVGVANYQRMLHDSRLHAAIVHTFIDAVVTVLAALVIGFFLALLLEGPARHLRILRTAVFLPVVTSAIAAAQLFSVLMYPTSDGVFNRLLASIGIGPFKYFADAHQSLASIMVVQVWQLAPYDMLLFVAGLATIDAGLYEAASIDGAGFWAKLRVVTLPALRPVTSVILTLGIVRGLRVFTEVYVLTGGGPNGSSETIITYTYQQGLAGNDLGYASAISISLLVVTVILAVLNLWWTSRREV